jgi:hypothetical protein
MEASTNESGRRTVEKSSKLDRLISRRRFRYFEKALCVPGQSNRASVSITGVSACFSSVTILTHLSLFAACFVVFAAWPSKFATEMEQTNNGQDWSFEWYRPDFARGAIDFQFVDVDIDFVPAIQAMRSALNDERPERFQNVRLKFSTRIQAGLKKHASSPRN